MNNITIKIPFIQNTNTYKTNKASFTGGLTLKKPLSIDTVSFTSSNLTSVKTINPSDIPKIADKFSNKCIELSQNNNLNKATLQDLIIEHAGDIDFDLIDVSNNKEDKIESDASAQILPVINEKNKSIKHKLLLNLKNDETSVGLINACTHEFVHLLQVNTSDEKTFMNNIAFNPLYNPPGEINIIHKLDKAMDKIEFELLEKEIPQSKYNNVIDEQLKSQSIPDKRILLTRMLIGSFDETQAYLEGYKVLCKDPSADIMSKLGSAFYMQAYAPFVEHCIKELEKINSAKEDSSTTSILEAYKTRFKPIKAEVVRLQSEGL